jgi:hypothetical protein
MTPTDEQINEFKNIYKKRFGYELTSTEARERGMSLIRIVKFTYRAITQAEVDALEWHRNNKLLN